MNEQKYCRVCNSKNIEEFRFNHFVFPFKKDPWKSFFCFTCGSVSEFNFFNQEIDYSKNSYRLRSKISEVDRKKDPNLPLDLWSIFAFKRWKNIYEVTNRKSDIFKNDNKINLLDFGGYNGALAYALKFKKENIQGFVADFNSEGLNFAKYLGIETINLSEKKITELKNESFDFITAVHVLEHMSKPTEKLRELNQIMKKNSYIYVEVPNLYGTQLVDSAHKVAFSEEGIKYIFESLNFDILEFGFTGTDLSTISNGYYYNNERENLYIFAKKSENNVKGELNNLEKTKRKKINSIYRFKLELYESYAKIMLKDISKNLLKKGNWFLKASFMYLIYGFFEYLFIKIVRYPFTDIILKFKSKRKD